MNQNWLNDQRLNQIGWDKRTFLINFMRENAYKSKEELLPVFLQLKSTMQRKNLSFTKQEQLLLAEIFESAMSNDEKQRFRFLIQTINRA